LFKHIVYKRTDNHQKSHSATAMGTIDLKTMTVSTLAYSSAFTLHHKQAQNKMEIPIKGRTFAHDNGSTFSRYPKVLNPRTAPTDAANWHINTKLADGIAFTATYVQ
jgi:hypothetical protein